MGNLDPFEMLGGPSDSSLRRTERAFALHVVAENLKSRIIPITPGELHELAIMGPMSFAHPATARGAANSTLLLLGAVCDGVARRLSPVLFE
jgi:hypothetical protein